MVTIVLAAGYGTRLYPLTLNKPKALLEVGKRTILDRLLSDIARIQECDKVYIISNASFYERFRDWARLASYPFEIEVMNDGTTSNETRLGAIGDINFVLSNKKIDEDLIVTASDNLFNISTVDFIRFANDKRPACSIALYDVQDRELAKRYGICRINRDRQVVDFQEKPESPKSTLAATALYFIPKERVGMVSKYMETDLSKDAPGNLMKWFARVDRLYGYVLQGKWYDIGDKESLKKADEEFTKKES